MSLAIRISKNAGSDPDKCLFLWDNRSNLGCFFLLELAFWGQKLRFKDFVRYVHDFRDIRDQEPVAANPNS